MLVLALLLAAPLRASELAAPATIDVPALPAMAAALPTTGAPALAPGAALPALLPLAAGPSVAAPASAPDAPSLLSRYEETNLSIDREHPAIKRYLELLRRLDKAWGEPPFSRETLRQSQLDAAAAVGLRIEDQPGSVLEISANGDHWLNRWTAGLQRSKGARLYWSPLNNHFGGNLGSWNAEGRWLIGDDLAPILKKPTTTLFHEFLHAYVDRGRHAAKFGPLRLQFERMNYRDLPKSAGRRTGYTQGFRADEILTNLHSTYDRARKLVSAYSGPRAGWTSSKLEQAPADIQDFVKTLDRPIFLTESAAEMSVGLLAGTLKTLFQGMGDTKFKKSYHRFEGSIPYAGEVEQNEKNDMGFYSAELKGPDAPLEVRFFTRGHFKDSESDAFPVILSRDGYATRVEFSRKAVGDADLDDPYEQERLARSAARVSAPRLIALNQLTVALAPDIERLKSLQARTKDGVDLDLVKEIMETARRAFLRTAFFFIGASAGGRGSDGSPGVRDVERQAPTHAGGAPAHVIKPGRDFPMRGGPPLQIRAPEEDELVVQ